MKDYLKQDGFITKCPRNISQMNIFEYMWYFCI